MPTAERKSYLDNASGCRCYRCYGAGIIWNYAVHRTPLHEPWVMHQGHRDVFLSNNPPARRSLYINLHNNHARACQVIPGFPDSLWIPLWSIIHTMLYIWVTETCHDCMGISYEFSTPDLAIWYCARLSPFCAAWLSQWASPTRCSSVQFGANLLGSPDAKWRFPWPWGTPIWMIFVRENTIKWMI